MRGQLAAIVRSIDPGIAEELPQALELVRAFSGSPGFGQLTAARVMSELLERKGPGGLPDLIMAAVHLAHFLVLALASEDDPDGPPDPEAIEAVLVELGGAIA